MPLGERNQEKKDEGGDKSSQRETGKNIVLLLYGKWEANNLWVFLKKRKMKVERWVKSRENGKLRILDFRL